MTTWAVGPSGAEWTCMAVGTASLPPRSSGLPDTTGSHPGEDGAARASR